MARYQRTFVATALASLFSATATAQPIESLAGTIPSSGDYGAVLTAIDAIGAKATSLTLFWDELEKDGIYQAEPDWPTIAEAVYPTRQIRIQLTFATIDTLTDRRPPDLKDFAWDHPVVVQRFVKMAQEALSRMPNVNLISIAIGNEVDGHLASDMVDEYASFFEAAQGELKGIRPDVPVTVKTTWQGLKTRPEILKLAQRGDALSITWYPMDALFHFQEPHQAIEELDEMAAVARGPWELSEVGYPSTGCGASSEEAQARFHSELTRAARTQPNLKLVQRVWSHDISSAEVEAYADYYNQDAACFGSFLSSLGLRTGRDEAKPAFDALTTR